MGVVYPACAGIDPYITRGETGIGCLPRMRGDRPYVAVGCQGGLKFTPHARGSTYVVYISLTQAFVYPACAGIDLCRLHQSHSSLRLPRMRGDRP